MRRLAIPVLLLAACDGQDSLGALALKRSDETSAEPLSLTSNTCVLSVAASRYRPGGLYVFAEVPVTVNLMGVLELDVPESGTPSPERVVYRELEGARELFRSEVVSGQVVLLGPPRERRGEFDLVFAQGKQMRRLQGSFAPVSQQLPAAGDTGTPSSGGDVSVDTSGCDSTDVDSSDSDGCDGSDSGGSDAGGDSCSGDSAGEGSSCDSSGGGGDSCGGSGGGSAGGCSGGAGGGGCSGDAHAAHAHRVMVRHRSPRALAMRIVSWLLPYALVGAFIQLARRWLRRKARPVALTW